MAVEKAWSGAVRSKPHERAAMIVRVSSLVLVCLLAACSEPVQRMQLRVSIDADSAVRAIVDNVTVVVAYQDAKGEGWRDAAGGPRRFEPKVDPVWPLEFMVDPRDVRSGTTYQVTATALDGRMAVVAQARAIRSFDSGRRWTLEVLFEKQCLRRAVCLSGETCTMGQCVDARTQDGSVREPILGDDGAVSDGGGPPTQEPVPIASDGESCDTLGTVACSGEMSRVPLRCEDATSDAGVMRVWRAEPQCKEDELCDTTLASELRGMCRAIAPECIGHSPNDVFCDEETMLVCSSMFKSEMRPCVEHALCVDTNKNAKCACRSGFVQNAAEDCVVATDCMTENGGCDKLTECTMQGGQPVCSVCPDGFFGDGKSGCSALLAGLALSQGTLSPAFSPNVTEYTVEVPLLVQRLTLTPSAPGAGRIAINGEEVESASKWTTPTLPLDDYVVDLSLTAPMSGTVRSYKVHVIRSGGQTAYVKASNTDASDRFGIAVDMDGDTLVVGAVYEDSAATGVNGDQASQASTDSGAAYVFVRKAGRWEQQAYLKASDTTAHDCFGTNVAVFGNTIAVGATGFDVFGLGTPAPTRPGSVYVFERKDGTWRQTQRLVPSGSVLGDLFGFGVNMDRDTIVVGGPGEAGSGAAYVFVRNGESWREQARLVPKKPRADSSFGAAVGVAGDMAVVTAYDDATERTGAGSANVFVRSGETWSETQRLVPNPGADGASFGYSVALTADVLLIGAPRLASITSLSQTTSGEVFAYQREGNTWQQTQVLKAIVARASDSFGSALAAYGDSAVIGACGDMSSGRGVGAEPSSRDSSYSGAGYLFARQGKNWAPSLYIKASNTNTTDSFGFGAAISESAAVLSAVWEASAAKGINGDETSNAAATSGAAYVFE
ncbi:MAG TPA: cadherin-like beta sandwich domain-containing protein [Polyangiales bacterium]|nr:cadherin-like beta sandwich domain-containing protein [Polyangiales bacterium]